MQRISFSVPDDILAAARQYAASKGTTVNALVCKYFRSVAHEQDRLERARAAILELSNQTKSRVGKITWTRDELHER